MFLFPFVLIIFLSHAPTFGESVNLHRDLGFRIQNIYLSEATRIDIETLSPHKQSQFLRDYGSFSAAYPDLLDTIATQMVSRRAYSVETHGPMVVALRNLAQFERGQSAPGLSHSAVYAQALEEWQIPLNNRRASVSTQKLIDRLYLEIRQAPIGALVGIAYGLELASLQEIGMVKKWAQAYANSQQISFDRSTFRFFFRLHTDLLPPGQQDFLKESLDHGLETGVNPEEVVRGSQHLANIMRAWWRDISYFSQKGTCRQSLGYMAHWIRKAAGRSYRLGGH